MATQYVWSEERQCMVPNDFVIENEENDTSLTEGSTVEVDNTDENEAVKAAKEQLAAAKAALKAAQGKTGRCGKPPLEFEAIMIGANVDKAKWEAFKTAFPDETKTNLVRTMLDLALEYIAQQQEQNEEVG